MICVQAPPSKPPTRVKRTKTVIDLEIEDPEPELVSQYDDFMVQVIVTREPKFRYAQGPFMVDPLKEWDFVQPLLLDLALEELRQDPVVKEGINIHSLTPYIQWKVVRGRSKDAPWCRLRYPLDWEAFIEAVNAERMVPKIEWTAFIQIDTRFVPQIQSLSRTEDLETPTRSSQQKSRPRNIPFARARNTATTRALQDVSVNIEGDPVAYHKLLAVQSLQQKYKCAQHHQNLCYVHPLSKAHRHINMHQQNRWADYIANEEPGVSLDQPPLHDTMFNSLREAFKPTDQPSATPESRSSSGHSHLPTPMTISRFDLNQAPPSTQVPDQAQPMRGSSPLSGPAGDDLDGFLEYVGRHAPAYTNFNIDVVRDAVVDHGIRLDDLKKIPDDGLPPAKKGWVMLMKNCWPVWKGIMREKDSNAKRLEARPFEVYEVPDESESIY
ncbi:hypothetical protein G7K_6929-t1 [Saitoella complicata NRRL Y-17804]|uniref:Uncharacterized protein n=1 Tax=Saitoella complicata (strain BCRC 22490 / CBS 7301 / JCM 7358 / NBRC 10748 / NRRL Y-17804) TaxID=698492 RepID=A0A0E9NT05_SAICN|nr:hypothetical protein G7K_6929-t1 [Saitoella complicata NRRL Y-17804]